MVCHYPGRRDDELVATLTSGERGCFRLDEPLAKNRVEIGDEAGCSRNLQADPNGRAELRRICQLRYRVQAWSA